MALPGQVAQNLIANASVGLYSVNIPVVDLGTVQTGQTVYYDNRVLGTIFDIDVANSIITMDASITTTIPNQAILEVTADEFTTVTLVELLLDDTVYRLSDAYTALSYDNGNVVYDELGSFLSVSDFVEDYKTTEGSITISISGIPNKKRFIDIIQNSKIKGGRVVVWREFLTSNSLRNQLELNERFYGLISNYNIEENTDVIAGQSTNTIVFEVSSVYTNVGRTIAGQKTNGADRRRYYPTDTTFDRISTLRGIPEFG